MEKNNLGLFRMQSSYFRIAEGKVREGLIVLERSFKVVTGWINFSK